MEKIKIGYYEYTYDEKLEGYQAEFTVKMAKEPEPPLSEIDGIPIVGISFYGCHNLKKAPKIPDTVVDMDGAFANCYSLEEPPVIPNSVKNMYGTFEGCKSLKEAPVIPNGVEDMTSTFANCTSLTEAPTIPGSIDEMYGTFAGCEKLTKAPKIPYGVKDMVCTFEGCKSLTEAPVIPKGVVVMNQTFQDCTSLVKSPVIPEGVEYMDLTFTGCTSLTEIPIIPDSVKDKDMFYDCFNLIEKLKDSIDKISFDLESYDADEKTITGTITINGESTEFLFDTANKNAYYGDDDEMSPELRTCVRCLNDVISSKINDEFKNINKLETKDYIYLYDMDLDGYKATVKDKTKTEYEPLLAEIDGKPLISLCETFRECAYLTKAPEIPYGVKDMDFTFTNCSSLIESPEIPDSVEHKYMILYGCTALENIEHDDDFER